jgi:hypothetical protein
MKKNAIIKAKSNAFFADLVCAIIILLGLLIINKIFLFFVVRRDFNILIRIMKFELN